MSNQSPTIPGSSTSKSNWKRPPSIRELASEATRTMAPWVDTEVNFKSYLRYAEDYRRAGIDCSKSGDIEAAFIKFAQAATLILERMPTHSQYLKVLSATQRHNLALNGQDILDRMSDIKPTLIALREEWDLNQANTLTRTKSRTTSEGLTLTFNTPELENGFSALNLADEALYYADQLYPRLEPTRSALLPSQTLQVDKSRKEESSERDAPRPVPPTADVVESLPPLYPTLRPAGPQVVDKTITQTEHQAKISMLDGKDASQSPVISNPSSGSVGVMAQDLTGFVTRDSEYAAHGGGYADVYKGVLRMNARSTKVAIKVLRAHIYGSTNQWKINKRLNREIRLWSGLRHPNIVPLLGITQNFGPHVAMVCPWMNDGNLNHYLDKRKAELNLQKRLQILVDVVEGLTYLHQKSIVHGDLTSANVLMDGGKAHLTDFGLSNVMADIRNASLLTSTVGGAPRWTAPELIMFGKEPATGPIADLTKQCDIYSFGSVALQVISGKIPYANILSDFQVLMEIMKGSPPDRPSEPLLSDAFWGLIISCLGREPSTRPEIDQVRETLQILRYDCSEEELAANIVDSDMPLGTEVEDD